MVTLETIPDCKRWWSGISNRKFVRSLSLLVKDNLRSPPLALLHPRSSLRAKDKYILVIAYSRRRKVNALEEKSVARNTILRRSVNLKEKERFLGPVSPRGNSLGTSSPNGTSPSGKAYTPTCYAFKKVECPKGNACDYWDPLESSQKEAAHLERSVRFKQTVQAGGEQKKRHNYVGRNRRNVDLEAKGNPLHGVSGLLVKSILQKVGMNMFE